MSRKSPKTLLQQTGDMFDNLRRRFETQKGKAPQTANVSPLSAGLQVRLSPNLTLSPPTLAQLAPYQAPKGQTLVYLLPWSVAVSLYPNQAETALPAHVANALELPPLLLHLPHATPDDAEGVSDTATTEAEDEWQAACAELLPHLPQLDTLAELEAKADLYGATLQLSIKDHNTNVFETPSGWLASRGSLKLGALPVWYWQLQQAHGHLQALLSNPDTKLAAYGLLQQVQAFASQQTPHARLVFDDKRLDGQRFLGVSSFQLAVEPSTVGDTADVLPFSDTLCNELHLSDTEFKRSMQQALTHWDGQTTLLLKPAEGNAPYASLMLTPPQVQALHHLKTHLYRKPVRTIKNFVYFPTQTLGCSEATEAVKACFNLDLSDFGPRVSGIGPIIKVAGSFGKSNYGSLMSQLPAIDEELPLEVAETPPPDKADLTLATGCLTYAPDDEDKLNPLIELPLPVTNPTEADLEPIRLPLAEATQLHKTLQQELQAQQNDPMHTGELGMIETVTDALTGQAHDLPITPTLVEGMGATLKQAHKELAERKHFLQIMENDNEARYAEYLAEQAEKQHQALWQLANQWVANIPRLKGSINLFDYQQQGVLWLVFAFLQAKPGVLFADDMGLGKTLQSLCFLAVLMQDAWAHRHGDDTGVSSLYDPKAFKHKDYCPNPILVVVPPVLMKNFAEQAEVFFDDAKDTFKMLLLHNEVGQALDDFKTDPTARGKETTDGKPRLDKAKLQAYRMVITTYDTVVNYELSFARIPWAVILCDEAQKAKDSKSNVSRVLKALASNTCFKLVMTGTPVENDLADLYNLMDIAASGMLAPSLKAFRETYAPLFGKGLADVEAPKVAMEQSMANLKESLHFNEVQQAWLLGRTKAEVAKGLPPKHEHELLTAFDVAEYQQQLHKLRHLPALQKLQQLKQYSLHPHFNEQGTRHALEWVAGSPRCQRVLEQLASIARQGDKALVFVEYHLAQNNLQQAINQQFSGHPRLKPINSACTKKDEVIGQFKRHAGFAALVLSPKCAGMGLNLQEANHVFHVSRWWNPAIEDQATCRAFRTGQQKPVHVYYCLSSLGEATDAPLGKTFDEALHDLLTQKRAKRTSLLSPIESVSPEEVSASMGLPVPPSIDMLDRLGQNDPLGKGFEAWVRQWWEEQGFRVERPHDRGIDFVAHPPDGSAPIGLQVKHSTDPNAPTTLAELRRFPTDCEKYGLNRGVFITNRTASVIHHAEFNDSNGLELELFDREAFKAYFAKLRGFPLG